MDDTIRRAAIEMQRPVFFSLVIIIAAYFPLFTLERVERRLFTPMAYTVCFALLGALLLALTLVPVLAAWVFRHGARTWRNPVLEWMFDRYEGAVRWTLAHTRLVDRHGGGARGVGRRARRSARDRIPAPARRRRDLDSVESAARDLPRRIRRDRGAHATTHPAVAGSQDGDVAERPKRLRHGSVRPQSQRAVDRAPPVLRPGLQAKPSAISSQELSQRLNSHIPGATFNITQPIIDTSTEIATGSSADLAVIITGPDLSVLRRLAAEVLEVVRTVPGAADTSIEQEADQSQLRIAVDRAVLARYGLNISDVQDVIELAIGGRAVGVVFEGERRFDLTVRYMPEARTDPAAIAQILVATPAAAACHWVNSRASKPYAVPASSRAARTNGRSRSGRTFESGTRAASWRRPRPKWSQVCHAAVRLPCELGRAVREPGEGPCALDSHPPVTILIVFGLLFVAFASVRDAALVLVNVPFSLVGGILALYLRGIHLSVSAAVGFVTLFGVAVMGGLLYVAEINRRLGEPGASLQDAVVSGAKSQVRPMFMLIVVAMLGMIPAAIATGIGSDIQRPLATVIVGGLASTLLLTLLVLPSLYYVTAGRRYRESRLAELFRERDHHDQ